MIAEEGFSEYEEGERGMDEEVEAEDEEDLGEERHGSLSGVTHSQSALSFFALSFISSLLSLREKYANVAIAQRGEAERMMSKSSKITRTVISMAVSLAFPLPRPV